MADRIENAAAKFGELVGLMSRLRAPGGCPWDRKQTFDSIKPYTLEETYEVLDAIDRRAWSDLAEELGDLMLQPVFLAEIAAEENLFTIEDALDAINQKLIRRHPHIFGDASAETPEDVKQRWDEIKSAEKAERGDTPGASILNGVARNLPALVEAEKIAGKAAKAGFEWPDVSGVVAKIEEEAAELVSAQISGDPAQMEDELGDLLFTVVNLARFLRIDPEQALRKTNARFRQRFAFIETETARQGQTLESISPDQMEDLWQAAKLNEKAR